MKLLKIFLCLVTFSLSDNLIGQVIQSKHIETSNSFQLLLKNRNSNKYERQAVMFLYQDFSIWNEIRVNSYSSIHYSDFNNSNYSPPVIFPRIYLFFRNCKCFISEKGKISMNVYFPKFHISLNSR